MRLQLTMPAESKTAGAGALLLYPYQQATHGPRPIYNSCVGHLFRIVNNFLCSGQFSARPCA